MSKTTSRPRGRSPSKKTVSKMTSTTKPAAEPAALKLPPGFRRWDVADYLNTKEDIAAYWEAVIEADFDDPEMLTSALNDIARAYGILKLSRDTGITRAGLYKALAPNGNPSLSTIVKISRALGLQLRLLPIESPDDPQRKERAA